MREVLEKQTVTIYGKTVAYWTNGNTSAMPAVFIHGFRGNHKGLAPTGAYAEDSFVIIPDLPGYGESEAWDHAPHTITAYCDWIHEFCETIGLHSYNLVGHSFGATLAILCAAKHPDHIAKLILIAPVIASKSIESFIGALFYRTAEYLPSRAQRYYLINQPVDAAANIMLLKSAPFWRKIEIITDGLRNIPNLNQYIIMENFTSMYMSDPLSAAKTITAPTHIIVGSKDSLSPLTSMKALQALIPQSTLTIIHNEGHIIPLENPAALGKAIQSALGPSSSPNLHE